ncbi:YfcE family phosphodiesterase [Candidatus Falkowbacteria bacterium]|nr:YfcE family phosphodiesterase [Candidatus Falkowbacteria bacterium]
MKIAIISDIHDNLVNLKKFLLWTHDNKAESIICCGDLTNSETLNVLASGFDGSIYLAKGNMELYSEKDLERYDNIEHGGKQACFKIDETMFGLCHEPLYIDKILKNDKPAIIFYGHTHKPWIEERNGIKVVNPGTLGGMFSRATFAVWDTDKKGLELKILDLI